MLRRFNSLIKGPKGQLSDDELNSELVVSLRPALSVDSSLFSSGSSHVNPLQQQQARLAREEALTFRHTPSENGQTSLNNAEPVARHGFPISRVPEEKSWKEGYEHKIEVPRVPRPSSEAAARVPRPSTEAPRMSTRPSTEARRVSRPSSEAPRVSKPSREAAARVSRPSSEAGRVSRTSSEANVSVLRTSSEAAGIVRTGSEAAGRALRTSSDGAAAVNQLPWSTDLRDSVAVDIPDAQPGSSVDLEALRKASAFNVGPGRTISSWSTDSAAEHCRICQQHTEEPLIDLGCACRGEMAKSHKSCIEMWFKNKGTNKCEVCQHEAKNITAPPTSPVPHFWVWRLGGPYGAAAAAAAQQQQQQQSGHTSSSRVGFQGAGSLVNRPVLLMIIRNHPLIPVMWLGLLAFMTYLFVDAINTSTIGYAAMPIGFLFVSGVAQRRIESVEFATSACFQAWGLGTSRTWSSGLGVSSKSTWDLMIYVLNIIISLAHSR